MFPFEDEDARTWTDYGAALTPEELRKIRGELLVTHS